jgi:hypothetical protein
MAKAIPPQFPVTPSAEGLAATAKAAGAKGPPPVHLWHPPHCGDIDMEIRRDGTWFYQGTPIGREGMVRLFASILRRDPDGFVLVTPVEKVGIRVQDAPFVAVDFEVEGRGEGQTITFTTNLGDRTTAGPDHPIRVTLDPVTGEPAPYVRVRGGPDHALEARIDRKSFYRLVDIGCDRDGWFGLWSGGRFFPVAPSAGG